MWRLLLLLLCAACTSHEEVLHVSAAESRGAALLAEGRAIEAAEIFSHCMTQDPRSCVAAFGAAEAAIALGDDRKAGLLLEHALTLMPRTKDALRFAGGALLFVAERTRESSRARQRALVAWEYLALAARPDSANDHLLVGRAALFAGEVRKAEGPLLMGWRLAPSENALRALAACWQACGVADALPKFLLAEQKAGVLTAELSARLALAPDLKPHLPPPAPVQ
jgi:tetratricopeptide (TPR) repeat protein